jgi:hypothetical protein
MNHVVYQILHVTGAFLLVAFTFQAFAAPTPERRSASMRNTGIMSFVVLVAGFGLAAKLGYGFPIWMMIKLVCWLGISAISGIAFRKPEKTGGLLLIAMLLILGAVLSVYLKPLDEGAAAPAAGPDTLPSDEGDAQLPG